MHIFKSTSTVIFRGQRFCLRRLGFGLNVATLIMMSVIDAIVSQDHTIKRATSACVDIFINESLVPASCVQQHFFGLWFGFQGSGATERRSQSSWLASLGKGSHSSMETRKSNSGNPGWINLSARIFSLRETCRSLPRMWMAQGGSCIYQAPGNCSNKGLG